MSPLDDTPLPGAEFRRGPHDQRASTGGAGSMDWDDVRVFLAVARHGSLRAAGRALGLSQPTIGRRLAAFEATFGGPTLFDRLPEGLRLNAAGEQLVPAAEGVERAALMLERRRAAASPELSGTVRPPDFSRAVCPTRNRRRCRRGLRWSWSSRGRRRISPAGRPISRCAIIRRKAAIFMS